jgi:para-nitrobenzyl esterase
MGWSHDDESFMFEWMDGQPSEDCLRLNVWTPSINDNRKRPVMVWIHGGGFTAGSGHELKAYDGENLSRRGDVVVVSLNHRLGALGYLDLMDYGEKWASSPNVGILDLIVALNWVKTNISNFGGDPGNVLIFGQSGGGSKVGILMAMPEAKGLFHRAVIQSGSNLRQLTHDRSATVAAHVIAELGLTRETLDKIQELPNEAIVQAGLRAQRKLAAAGGPTGGPGWGPVVDGKILPRHSWDPDAPSHSADVPLMVGSVLNEMTNSIQMGDPTADTMSMDDVRKRLTAQRGEKSETILAAFQKAYPKDTPFDLYSRIGGMTARMNALTQAERKAAQGAAPAYVYLFQWQTPLLDGRPRAFHCSELPFVFYNTELCAAMTGGGPETIQLSSRIADAWINFARNGNPNHPGLPAWPVYNADKVPTMIFDTQCAVKNNPDGPERQAFRQA